ncbi:hypothetical protein EYF80_063454 [Liparis tanakae]|uniref:Uncharacterized protein n=1 Tax=Liparis tanakae TaxID=230148 RepID=A0A4Z2EC59_9TELE|nr:hypothetical protein EYF80_063454 [Liparis tanakae]
MKESRGKERGDEGVHPASSHSEALRLRPTSPVQRSFTEEFSRRRSAQTNRLLAAERPGRGEAVYPSSQGRYGDGSLCSASTSWSSCR